MIRRESRSCRASQGTRAPAEYRTDVTPLHLSNNQGAPSCQYHSRQYWTAPGRY